jgi:glycosyltransferase involved in cell wall biosynthesis
MRKKEQKASINNLKVVDIGVCILFYERVNQTVECIQSFLPSKVNIYILNNGSSALNREKLGKFCEDYKQIKIFDSKVNLGVGRGRNYLVNKTEEEWLFFVDNDIIIKTKDWMKRFTENLTKYPDIDVFIPRLFNVNEKKYIRYCSIRVEDNKAIHDLEIEDGLTNVFPGGASIINRNLFNRLGLYDDDMFVGFEDFELCIRGILSNNPVRARLINDIELIHNHQMVVNSEDRKAVLNRYNFRLIEQSYNHLTKKHNIVLISSWRSWVKKQLKKILQDKTSFNKELSGRKLKVGVGPLFEEVGGVSQYIMNIKKYSNHRIKEIPPKFIRMSLNKTVRGRRFYKYFMNKIGLKGYNVIHSNVNPWFTNLCKLSKRDNVKWIHTYHTIYFEEDYNEGLKKWQREINKSLIEVASRADIKISISKWLHDYLFDNYSIKTEIIPNGVDLELCSNANPNRFKTKYNLNNFILFVGNIERLKNPSFFVKLASKMPEIKFVMIGRNLDEKNLKSYYKINIPKNLITKNIMQHMDVLDAIAACDVFVMTSKREGIPTALLEAMAIGKIVVVPNHSGCKEVLESSNNGFLYEPDSIDDLIDNTKKALISDVNIKKNARKRVLEVYDWKVLIKKIDLLYET